DDVNGFARALEALLTNDDLRKEMGKNGYRVTIPYFTWRDRVTTFLDEVGFRRFQNLKSPKLGEGSLNAER
ncbi:MAG: glycosyltransferase, partial [Chloroflexota bacterium]|nr:glycosyltransferase [Chloroflexota bacterium]